MRTMKYGAIVGGTAIGGTSAYIYFTTPVRTMSLPMLFDGLNIGNSCVVARWLKEGQLIMAY